jgi:putative DNA primase/helicase
VTLSGKPGFGGGQMASKKKLFARTDAGNAEALASVFKNEICFNHQRDAWFEWRGAWGEHWWAKDNRGSILQRALNIARLRAEAAGHLPEKEMQEELKWARTSESRTHLEAMVALGKSEPLVSDPGYGWDSKPWLFPVANGVMDLRTGRFRKGDPADKITLHADIVYDRKAKCPLWDKFLLEIFNGDQELIAYVQRAVGYCLTGEISEQCFFVCYGTGANGKSTFLEILRRIVGQYGLNLPFSAFEQQGRSSIPNDIAAVAGKRLVTSLETNEFIQLNEARLKSLTGGDQITARFLFKEFFDFCPTAKFWLACNHLPRVGDDSRGFWRRVHLIPFLQSFEGREDRGLLGKLTAEAPGILNWALEGCLKWQKEGLRQPPTIKAATDAYRQDSDRLADFIDEYCFVGPEKRVAASELWSSYALWASEARERESLDRKGFSRQMEAKGFKKVRVGHHRTWTWVGIDLKIGSSACVPGPVPSPLRPPTLRTDADVKFPIVTQ